MSGLFTPEPGEDSASVRQRKLALFVVMTGTLMAVLDTSIVNVALPVISLDLNSPPAVTVWVANSYRLVLAASLLGFAALGDRLGHRRVYTGGLLLFTAASMACALSHSIEALVISRIAQGIGGAALWSVSAALFRYIFPSRVLGAAMGLNALAVAVANGSGPVVGGAILSFLTWPWIFAVNVPIGLSAAFFARRVLPAGGGREGGFDFQGALLSAMAMGLFVVFVDSVSQDYSPAVLFVFFAGSLVSIWGFVRRQDVASFPLVPLRIFSSSRFSMALIVSTISYLAQGVGFVALPFLFQRTYGYDPLVSGLLFAPWPGVIIFVAPLAGRLADKIGVGIPSVAGLVIESVALALLALLGDHPTIPDILWRVSLCGLGIGLCQTPNNREIMASVPRALSGTASGLLGAARTFGQALGNAVVAIFLSGISTAVLAGANSPLLSQRMHEALWAGAGLALCAVLISVGRAGKGSSALD